MMKHKKLWLTIAKAFGTPEDERSQAQTLITRHGLCNAIFELTQKGESREFYLAFRKCWKNHRFGWAFWFLTQTPKSNAQRCLFACFMAALTKKEYNEMLEDV